MRRRLLDTSLLLILLAIRTLCCVTHVSGDAKCDREGATSTLLHDELRRADWTGAESSDGKQLLALLRSCQHEQMLLTLDELERGEASMGADVLAALRADALLLEGHARRATAQWERAITLAEDVISGSARRSALYHFLRGHTEAALGWWHAAASSFDAAIAARSLMRVARLRAPALHGVEEWRVKMVARLGDGEQYMAAVRQQVVAKGGCAHWPQFCVLLPRPSSTLPPIPTIACSEESPPPTAHLEAERQALAAAAATATRADAERAAAEPPGRAASSPTMPHVALPPLGSTAVRETAARSSASTDRSTTTPSAYVCAGGRTAEACLQDLISASRALECSDGFVGERLREVHAARPAAEAVQMSTRTGAEEEDDDPHIQFSYGQVYWPGVRQLLSRPAVARALHSAAHTGQSFVHLGSNIGTESFYVALSHGPSLAVRGYEVLCSLVAHATSLRDAFDLPAASINFTCADALTASLGDAAVVWLDNQAWEPPLMRQVYAKLAAELPDGALVVDFAAMDAPCALRPHAPACRHPLCPLRASMAQRCECLRREATA